MTASTLPTDFSLSAPLPLTGELRVIHWPAPKSSSDAALAQAYAEAAPSPDWAPGAFFLGTCQRKIWVSTISRSSQSCAHLGLPAGASELRGFEAYRLLLRVATGLASQVRGESDIFGQLKEAWQKEAWQKEAHSAEAATSWDASRSSRAVPPPISRQLAQQQLQQLKQWMSRLFEDTKEIRASYLQNVGGDSYGSLVRRILKKASGGESSEIAQPILLVGAGKIAQSIAPWLAQHELWILNRGVDAAHALARDLASRPGGHGARIRVLETQAEKDEAWRLAAHAVICIPPENTAERSETGRDSSWAALWTEASAVARRSGSSAQRTIVHLGGGRQDLNAWKTVSGLFSLDDLFELQRGQNQAREELFERAERACERKALLRTLRGSTTGSAQGSTSLPHGWEDLALFA